MAKGGADDLDADFESFGRGHLDLFDEKGLAGGSAHGRFAANGLGGLIHLMSALAFLYEDEDCV